MKLKRILVLLSLILLGRESVSLASNFTIVGGLSSAGGTINPTTGYTVESNSGYGGGFLVGFDMLPRVSFEWGLLYMPRGFVQNYPDSRLEVSFNTIQAPAVFRLAILPALSVGVGAYYSHALTNATYSEGTLSPGDYGILGSVNLKIVMVPWVSLVFDGRYLSGLSNVSQTGGTFINLSDFQVLGGIRFGR